ncbi:MAG: CarD family transcriptional regulator [Bacilli bacterium]
MYKVGDHVVYRRDVCQVKNIKKSKLGEDEYYVLVPIDDASLTIDIPVDNRRGFLRDLITEEEVENIISHIQEVEIIDKPDKLLENEYRLLLNTGDHLDLVKIIKTAYARNKYRLDNKKKTGDKDSYYHEKAEKYLYNEFGIILGLNFEDTKSYVTDKVSETEKIN